MTTEVVGDPSGHFEDQKLWIPFAPRGIEIEVDYSMLDAPLKELKKIWKATRLPEGRENCDDCKKMELLLGIEQRFDAQDQHLLRAYSFDRNLRNTIWSDAFRRQQLRCDAFRELERSGDLAFSSDGLLANWEFLHEIGNGAPTGSAI